MRLKWSSKSKAALIILGDLKSTTRKPAWSAIAEQIGFDKKDRTLIANMYRYLKLKERQCQ